MTAAIVHILHKDKIIKKRCETQAEAIHWLGKFINRENVFGYTTDGSFAFVSAEISLLEKIHADTED